MKMIKRITMLVLILLLSGCSLALTQPIDEEVDQINPQANIIGIWVQTSSDQIFDLANAHSLTYVAFQKRLVDGMPSSHSEASGIFYDSNMDVKITDEGDIITFTSTIPLKSDLDQILAFYTLIENEQGEIALGERQSGFLSSNNMLANVNYSFTQQSMMNGESENRELHFDFQFSYHKPLESIRIIEMNSDYEIIDTANLIDTTDYTLNESTHYFIIEQKSIDLQGQSKVSITSYSSDDLVDSNHFSYDYFIIDENDVVRVKTISIRK